MDLVESWLKLMEIDSKCIKISAIWVECMKFEVDVVWSLDPQLFEWYDGILVEIEVDIKELLRR